jgi:hypothetical protein
MALVGAPAIRLLESQLFLIIQWTDGCVLVWPVKDHAADDFEARARHDWVGRIPPGGSP